MCTYRFSSFSQCKQTKYLLARILQTSQETRPKYSIVGCRRLVTFHVIYHPPQIVLLSKGHVFMDSAYKVDPDSCNDRKSIPL